MFRSVQWRIAVPFILLIIISMGALGIYLTRFVDNSQIDTLRSHLEKEARITAEASLPSFLGQDGSLDTLAKKLGQEINTRITIIAPDGTVLGDSQEDPTTLENHATRPEVVAALSADVGYATRYSATLHENMMYVAVTITDQGKLLGIARVALPLAMVQSSVSHITLIIGLATLIAAILAIVAAGFIARLTTGPMREMTEAAKRIASGELAQKIPARTRDETGQLAQAFNEMSSNLDKLVGDISVERNRLRTVLSSMADGVIMADPEGKTVLANQATEKFFNFREKDVLTRPLIEVVYDHEADEILKRCLRTGQPQSGQFESAASKRFLRVIAVPIVEGKLTGALVLFQDLTEVRSLQTMRRDLVGNISHDLRTPLAGIKIMGGNAQRRCHRGQTGSNGLPFED